MKKDKDFTITKDSITEFWFQSTDNIFNSFSRHVLDADDKDKRRIFIDNGSQVLFVAHLDTVLPPKIIKKKEDRVWAQGLDDRLGALIAYRLSKKLGADLLLTDNEEVCASTARYHELKDDYNWIVEFDRAGIDVVTYDIDSPEFLGALYESFPIGFGSYSDICSLEYPPCCCFNLGIGYHHAHSKDSYVELAETNLNIELFVAFFKDNIDVLYEYDGYMNSSVFDYSDYYGNSHNDSHCEFCNDKHGIDCHGYIVCKHCFESMVNQTHFF